MPGAKFVEHANHVLNVLSTHDAWAKSQRELGHVTGVRPSLLSEVIRALEETGRVQRGEALSGPGRQQALVVVDPSPLEPGDLDENGRGLSGLARVVALHGVDEEEAQEVPVFNLLRQTVDRLEELAVERKVAARRLRDLRDLRDAERARADEEIALLRNQVEHLRRQNHALLARLGPGRSRATADLDDAVRDLLERAKSV